MIQLMEACTELIGGAMHQAPSPVERVCAGHGDLRHQPATAVGCLLYLIEVISFRVCFLCAASDARLSFVSSLAFSIVPPLRFASHSSPFPPPALRIRFRDPPLCQLRTTA